MIWTMTCDTCDEVFTDGIDAGNHEIATGHRVSWSDPIERLAARGARELRIADAFTPPSPFGHSVKA